MWVLSEMSFIEYLYNSPCTKGLQIIFKNKT